MNVEFTLRPGNEKSPFEFTELKRFLRSKRLYSNSVNEFHWISPKFIYFRGLQAFLSFMRVKRSDILSTSRMVNQTSQFFFSLFVVRIVENSMKFDKFLGRMGLGRGRTGWRIWNKCGNNVIVQFNSLVLWDFLSFVYSVSSISLKLFVDLFWNLFDSILFVKKDVDCLEKDKFNIEIYRMIIFQIWILINVNLQRIFQ